ncbi:MAG: response regulator [Ignavibacteria bacterium]|jgi:DNA-binding response OmpR family regulator
MKKIAVVDDKNEIVEALDELFSNFDYQVDGFRSAEDLLKVISNSKPDLIICDVMMPGKDAFELFSELKQGDDTKHIPFFILSADANKSQRIKSIEMGICEYITKPYDSFELLDKVREYIG